MKVSDINDNCPELSQTLYQLKAIPALQVSALAGLNATDIDSGNNSALSFYLSTITEEYVSKGEEGGGVICLWLEGMEKGDSKLDENYLHWQ